MYKGGKLQRGVADGLEEFEIVKNYVFVTQRLVSKLSFFLVYFS